MTTALMRLNFRDLGGLPGSDGRTIRPGLLFRSEGPASFAEEHRRELREIGFKLICDLRADVERTEAPNDWTGTAKLLNLDVTADLRTETNAGWSALRDDPSEAGANNAMLLNYRAIPEALRPHLRILFDAMLAGEMPMLMHCTAGKDRTGVLVGLVLSALGVARDTIEADYLRSDVFGKNLRLGGSIEHAFSKTFGFVPSEATIAAMIGVFPDFLDAAFDAIDARWGSLEAYFDAADVNAALRAKLQAALLA